jgi:hypothetical protein
LQGAEKKRQIAETSKTYIPFLSLALSGELVADHHDDRIWKDPPGLPIISGPNEPLFRGILMHGGLYFWGY